MRVSKSPGGIKCDQCHRVIKKRDPYLRHTLNRDTGALPISLCFHVPCMLDLIRQDAIAMVDGLRTSSGTVAGALAQGDDVRFNLTQGYAPLDAGGFVPFDRPLHEPGPQEEGESYEALREKVIAGKIYSD